MAKNKDSSNAIPVALIGAAGIAIGAILTAFLTPMAQRMFTAPVPTVSPMSIGIEEIPFTVYSYEGKNEPSCCVGEAELEFTNDSNLRPVYALDYLLPEDETKFGYAGVAFVFEPSRNLSEYKAIEFTIIFGEGANQADVNLEDITLTDVSFHITGEENQQKSIVVPLVNFMGVDLNAVRSIEFEVLSDYTSGRHWFAVTAIRLTK
jgi:hypothetical protein